MHVKMGHAVDVIKASSFDVSSVTLCICVQCTKVLKCDTLFVVPILLSIPSNAREEKLQKIKQSKDMSDDERHSIVSFVTLRLLLYACSICFSFFVLSTKAMVVNVNETLLIPLIIISRNNMCCILCTPNFMTICIFPSPSLLLIDGRIIILILKRKIVLASINSIFVVDISFWMVKWEHNIAEIMRNNN